MDYSNFTHSFYHHPINTAPSSLYPTYIPPFSSTNTPLTTPSPNMCFNHGYTPPSLTPSSLPNPYSSYPTSSNQYIYGYTPPTLTPSPSPNPYISSLSPQTPPPSYPTATIHAPISFSSNQHYSIHPPTLPLCYQQQPKSYSQPVTTMPNVEIVQRSLNEILEFIKTIQSEMKESHLAFKRSSQQLSYSDKTSKIEGKTSPKCMVQEELEDQSAKEGEPPKQTPQQLPRPPISTPSSEFENSKTSHAQLPVPSPPASPPSPAPTTLQEPSDCCFSTIPPPPPKPPDRDLQRTIISFKTVQDSPDMQLPFSIAHLPYYSHSEIFVVKELFDFLSLKGAHQIQSPALDPSIMALEKSQPCAESTIRVKLYCPITRQHVALHISIIPSTHSQPAFPHTIAFPRVHQVTLAAPILLSPSGWPPASKNSTSTTIEALMVIPYFHAQNMCLPVPCMNSKFTSYYYVPSTNFNAWATNSTHEIVGLLMGHDMLSLFISHKHINGQWKHGVQSTTSFLPFKQWDPGKQNYSILIIILQP